MQSTGDTKMSDFTIVNTRTLTRIVKAALNRDDWQPFVVLGAPGSGKSYFARDTLRRLIAAHHGIEIPEGTTTKGLDAYIGLVTIKPAEKDGVEVAGVALPMELDGEYFTRFTVSPVIKKIQAVQATGVHYVVVLIDELAQAGMPEQKVLSSTLDPEEYAIGDNNLPDGCYVYGTGNRAGDKSGALKILSHLLNRARFIEISRDVSAWVNDYAIGHGVNPILIEVAQAYDDFFAEEVPAEQTSYCTERSLTQASKDLDVIMADPEFTGFLPAWGEAMIASNIGQAAARRVSEWIARRDEVPSAEEIMRDPRKARVSDNTGFQLIAANVGIGAVTDSVTATAAFIYLTRLRADLQISLACKLLKMAATAGWIITDPAAQAFIAEHFEYLPLVGGN
jgi:hypothetical protein